jgi:DMSO reductase iron-sulfur subunit
MELPLLDRATEGGTIFLLTSVSPTAPAAASFLPASPIPQRPLADGEQYRFHFDMTKCVGCKCCIVACNEQNGNPAEIHWRRVGEIEGGWYPNAQRFYLSMGCNHCLEPSCLTGCPVNAYQKDAVTGVVLHSADACIGCQYCTWNCSYGVPQYNPERGVVGKCDMCHERLAEGREPACVNACPSGAIQIEIVNIANWKREYTISANAPGLPPADDSISSTRITLPEGIPPNAGKVDSSRFRLEDPHWPLVAMTILTQLSAGAFTVIWLLQLVSGSGRLGAAAVASLAAGLLALGGSTLHLGRPVHAYRALRMWRRSWLSREVLMFALFSLVAGVYAGGLWWQLPGTAALGLVTAMLGILGVTASACIYLVPARPAWNTKHTLADFYLTAAVLGPLFARSIGAAGDYHRWLLGAIVISTGAQLLNQVSRFFWFVRSDAFELQASARLMSSVLASRFLLRAALLIAGGIALPLFFPGRLGNSLALATALAGEVLGRYLFFVSVVPKNMAAPYLAIRGRAA